MKVLRDPTAVALLTDDALKQQVKACFSRLEAVQPYDPDVLGWVAIAEPGDTLSTLERETGCPILTGWNKASPYGNAGFSPAWEYLDEHSSCYEMVFVLSDSGYGVALYVPKVSGIDPVLRQLCIAYAAPATT